MLSLCQNLSLVFYFWRSVAFTSSLFPCARLCNPVLEVAMLQAVVGPCDLLGSFPNQIIPWFCETVWKHGWQFWVWHVAPESDSSVFPKACWWLGWQRAAERLQNELLGLRGAWLVVGTAGTSKPLAVLNCGSQKPTARLFEGTSTGVLAGKRICFGQCVKELWTVRFKLCSRWEARCCLRLDLQEQPAEYDPSCSGSSLELVLTHLLARWANKEQPWTWACVERSFQIQWGWQEGVSKLK